MCNAWFYLITTSVPERLKKSPQRKEVLGDLLLYQEHASASNKKWNQCHLTNVSYSCCQLWHHGCLLLDCLLKSCLFTHVHHGGSQEEVVKQFYVNHHPEVNHHANLLASSQHSYYIYFLCEKITHFVSFLSRDANLTQMNGVENV